MQDFAARKFCCIRPDTLRRRFDGPTLRWPDFRSYRQRLNSALATLAKAHTSLLK
jgi:hypothetical protein